MGDPKLLAKFRRLCDDYNAEFVIEGVVESFDTIYPVPPERLTRGMIINIGEETRFVDFHITKRPPVDIGDRVVIVGSNYSVKKDDVLPVVILSPTEKWVMFTREDVLKGPSKSELTITLMGAGAAIVVWLILRYSYPLLAWGTFLGFILLCNPPFLWMYLRRPRLYSCSEQEYNLLSEEITARFDPRLNSRSENHSQDVTTSPS
jgi:hypothetical protein